MRWMIFSVLAVLVVAHSSFAAPKPAPAPAKPPAVSGSGAAKAADAAARRKAEGWPDSRLGVLASGWVEAFSAGEDAMRDYIQHHMTAASIVKKSMTQRLETYRKNREKFGTLMLVSVVKEARNELTVTLMTADGSTQTFVFTAQSAPPWKLESVGRLERHQTGGHFGFH